MENWRKEDPPSKKKLPVGIDVTGFLADLGMEKDATEIVKAVGDFKIIAFYYLMRVGNIQLKNKEMKQSKRCSLSWNHTMFFRQDAKKHLR